MDISELNNYLIHNIHKSCGDFLSEAPYRDEYDRFRRDNEIYCYSGMLAVVKQVSTSPGYSQWMQQQATDLYCSHDEEDNRKAIVQNTYNSVTGDGDDICDEQSVGWYMAVHTYMHCLAFNTFDFKSIFESSWRKYFSVEFQDAARGYNPNPSHQLITQDFVDLCLNANKEDIHNYRYQLRMKYPYGATDDTYLTSLCLHAKEVLDTIDQTSENFAALVMAANSLYMEETMKMFYGDNLIILAKKILSAK